MNETTHSANCKCDQCVRWFAQTPFTGPGTGRCGRCDEPIDRHQLDQSGMIMSCPKRPTP